MGNNNNGDLVWMSVQIPANTKEKLEEEAKLNERTLSSLVRYILKKYLGEI